MIDPETLLMAIGGLVVVLIAVFMLYVAFLVGTGFVQRGLYRAAHKAFYAGGGNTNTNQITQYPEGMYCRLWIELVWFASVIDWIHWKLGLINYTQNPAKRPNMRRMREKMQERAREKSQNE